MRDCTWAFVWEEEKLLSFCSILECEHQINVLLSDKLSNYLVVLHCSGLGKSSNEVTKADPFS